MLTRNLAKELGKGDFAPGSWADAVRWIKDNPEPTAVFQEQCAKELGERQFVLVCDMLPLAGVDKHFQYLALRNLMRLALHCKGFRNIRTKAAITPEMLSGAWIFDFPDASKIYTMRSKLFGKNYEELGMSIVRKQPKTKKRSKK